MQEKIKEANIALSLTWKQQSKMLFDNAKNEEKFYEAVKWCGAKGNVSRTISGENNLRNFVKYLWDNIDKISDGNFNIQELNNFGKNKPYSWASKVCHIINPQKYPIIYDSNMKKAYDFKNIEEYIKIIEKLREEIKVKKIDDFYKMDSEAWAKQI